MTRTRPASLAVDDDRMTAVAVMSAPLVVVDADDDLGAVWNALRGAGVSHAVVVREQRCVGVLDVTQVWSAWVSRLPGENAGTAGVLAQPAQRIAPQTVLPVLCAALRDSGAGAVLVESAAGAVVGIVTSSDVLAALAELA